MTEKRKSPALRFRGYTDDWEQRELGEVVDVCSGRDYKHLSDGDIPVYGTGGYMLSVSKALSYDKDAIGVGRKGTIDKPYILNAPFWTVDTLFYAIPREKVDLNFAFNLFQNIDWKKKDESTGVPSLSKAAINGIDVLVPQYGEQQLLGQFFYRIDSLITLHQRKLEKLKLVKKSMLEKMFPKNGSSVPEIRFNGFTDDWEQRKLGITNTFFTDGNYGEAYPKASDMTDSGSGIPFLTGGNLKEGKISLDGVSYITPEKHSQLTSGHLLEDDIVIAVRGSLGALGYVNTDNSGWNINSQLAILRTDKSELYGKFLIQYLLSWAGQNELLKRQTGSALKQLPIGALKDFEVPITSVVEQKKIGAYFQSLDNLITLHQCKVEKLQILKKSMLEKMFV